MRDILTNMFALVCLLPRSIRTVFMVVVCPCLTHTSLLVVLPPLQFHAGSITQELEQPSPSSVLLSSHWTTNLLPSPHTSWQVLLLSRLKPVLQSRHWLILIQVLQLWEQGKHMYIVWLR